MQVFFQAELQFRPALFPLLLCICVCIVEDLRRGLIGRRSQQPFPVKRNSLRRMLLQIFLPRLPGKSRFSVIGLHDVLPVADLLFPGFFLIITGSLHWTTLSMKIVGDGILGLCHPVVIGAPVSGHHPPQIPRSQHLCQLEEIAVPPGFPFLRFCFSCCDTQKHLLHFILKTQFHLLSSPQFLLLPGAFSVFQCACTVVTPK